MKKLAIYTVLVTALAVSLMAGRSMATGMRADNQVVRVLASTFRFEPGEITVKKGVPVTLELVSKDRHHGFNLPDFHLRLEVKPGVVEKVTFVPDKVGKFTFVCDVFCGDGHDEMSGTLIVIE